MSPAAPALGTLLRQLVAAFDGGVQQIYDRMGVDFRPRFFPIATALGDAGTLGVSALAERIGMTQPAVSQTLREMERAGLIAWSAAADRRQRLVSLSAKGQALCVQLRPVWEAAVASVTEIEAEIDGALIDMLVRTLAALGDRPFNLRIREKMR